MSFKRFVAVFALVVAVAGCGAVAFAQTESGDEVTAKDKRELRLGLDPARDYPLSFLRTAEHLQRMYPDSEPGPILDEDEGYAPPGPVPATFVKSCNLQVAKDPMLRTDPLCRAVLLRDLGLLEPGVFKIADVKERWEAVLAD